MGDIIYASHDELPDPCIPETQEPEIVTISSSDGEEPSLPPKANVQPSGQPEPLNQDVVLETESCCSDEDDMLFTPLKEQNLEANERSKTKQSICPLQGISQYPEKSQTETNFQTKKLTERRPGLSSGNAPFTNNVPIQSSERACSSKSNTGSFLAANSNRIFSDPIPQYQDSSSDCDPFNFFSQVSEMTRKIQGKDTSGKNKFSSTSTTSTSKKAMSELEDPSTPKLKASSTCGRDPEMDDEVSPVFSKKSSNSSNQVNLSSQTLLNSPLFSLSIGNSYSNSQSENLKTALAIVDKDLDTKSSEQNTNANQKIKSHSEKNSHPTLNVMISEKLKVEEADSVDGCSEQKSANNALYEVTDEGSLYVFDSDDEEMFLSQMVQHGSLESEDLSNRDTDERNVWDDDDDDTWLAEEDYCEPEQCGHYGNANVKTNLCNSSSEEDDFLREEGGFLADGNDPSIIETIGSDGIDNENEQTVKEISKPSDSKCNAEESFKRQPPTKIDPTCRKSEPKCKFQVGKYNPSCTGETYDLYNAATQVSNPDPDYEFNAQTLVDETGQVLQNNNKRDGNEPAYDADDEFDPYSISTQEITYDPDDNDPFCVQTMASESIQTIDTLDNANKSESGMDDHDSCDDVEDPYNVPTQVVTYSSDEEDLFCTPTLACDVEHNNNICGLNKKLKMKNKEQSFENINSKNGYMGVTKRIKEGLKRNRFQGYKKIRGGGLHEQYTQSKPSKVDNIPNDQTWNSGDCEKIQKKDRSIINQNQGSDDAYNIPTQVVVSDSDESDSCADCPTLNSDSELPQGSHMTKNIQEQMTNKDNPCDYDPYDICTQVIDYDSSDNDPFCMQTMIRESAQAISSPGKLNKFKSRKRSSTVSSEDEDPYGVPTQAVSYDSEDSDPFCTSTLALEGHQEKQSSLKPSCKGIKGHKKNEKDIVIESRETNSSGKEGSSGQSLVMKALKMIDSSTSSDDDEPIFALSQKDQTKGVTACSIGHNDRPGELSGRNVRGSDIDDKSYSKTSSYMSEHVDPHSLSTQRLEKTSKPSLQKVRNNSEKRDTLSNSIKDKNENLRTTGIEELRIMHHDKMQMVDSESNDENNPFLQNTQVVDEGNTSEEDPYCKETQVIDESNSSIDQKSSTLAIHRQSKGDQNGDRSAHKDKALESVIDSNDNHKQLISMVSNNDSGSSKLDDLDEAYFLPTQVMTANCNSQGFDRIVTNTQQEHEGLSSDDDIFMLPTQPYLPDYSAKDSDSDQQTKHARSKDCKVPVKLQVTSEKGDDACNTTSQIAKSETLIRAEACNKQNLDKDGDVDDAYFQLTQIVHDEPCVLERSENQFSKHAENFKEADKSDDDAYDQPTQDYWPGGSEKNIESRQQSAEEDVCDQNAEQTNTDNITNIESIKDNQGAKLMDRNPAFSNKSGPLEAKQYHKTIRISKKENIPVAPMASTYDTKATSSTGISLNSSLHTHSSKVKISKDSHKLEAVGTVERKKLDTSFEKRFKKDNYNTELQNKSFKPTSSSKKDNHLCDDHSSEKQVTNEEHSRNLFETFDLRPKISDSGESSKNNTHERIDNNVSLHFITKHGEATRDEKKSSNAKKRIMSKEQADSERKKKPKISSEKQTWLSSKATKARKTPDINHKTVSSGLPKAKKDMKRSKSVCEQSAVQLPKRKRRNSSSASSANLNKGIQAAKSVLERRRLSAQKLCAGQSGREHTNAHKAHMNTDSNFYQDAEMPSAQALINLGLPIMNAVLPVNKRLLAQGLPSRNLESLDQSSASENPNVVRTADINSNNSAQASCHSVDHLEKLSPLNKVMSVRSLHSKGRSTPSNDHGKITKSSNSIHERLGDLCYDKKDKPKSFETSSIKACHTHKPSSSKQDKADMISFSRPTNSDKLSEQKDLNHIQKESKKHSHMQHLSHQYRKHCTMEDHNKTGKESQPYELSMKTSNQKPNDCVQSSTCSNKKQGEPVNGFSYQKDKIVNKPDLDVESSSHGKNLVVESVTHSKDQVSHNHMLVEPHSKNKNIGPVLGVGVSKSSGGTKQGIALNPQQFSHTISCTPKQNITNIIEASNSTPTTSGTSFHRSILKRPAQNDAPSADPRLGKMRENTRICDTSGKRINFDESKNKVWTFNPPIHTSVQFNMSGQNHQRVQSRPINNKSLVGDFRTDMIKSLLKWNPDWLPEQGNSRIPPPLLGHGKSDWQNLEGLRLYYSTPQEYAKITCNLLKLELWEGIFKEWNSEEKNRLTQSDNKAVHLRYMPSENNSMSNESDLSLFQMEGFFAEQGFFLYPGDILLLNAEDKKATTQFAYVKQFKKIGSANFDISLETKNRLVSSSKGLLTAVKLCSVVTDERLMGVLNSVQHNQFLGHLVADPLVHKHIYHHQFIEDQPHPTLNKEQARAVFTIRKAVLSPAEKVFLLQGPPGTGKSHTIMVLIHEILLGSCYKKRICLATPSNAAVDELAQRIIIFSQKLQKAGRPCIKMVRIGKDCIDHNIRPYSLRNLTEKRASMLAERHTPDSVKTEIKMHKDKIEQLKSSMHRSRPAEEASIRSELNKLEKKLRNLQEKPNKQDFWQAEREVLQESHVICGTLSSFGQPKLHVTISRLDQGQPFGCIIVDEATQAKEVECLIPLQFSCQKLVLVGDQEQLQPTVLSHKAQEKELGRSLFTRLHMCLTQRETVEGSAPTNISPVLSLRRQYRMADAILQFPNEAFYQGKLFTDKAVQSKRISNPYKLAQYLVFDISDSAETKGNSTESMSKTNPVEAECAGVLCDLVNELIRKAADRQNRVVCQERIGVISPYRMQKKEIERQLQKRNLRRIAVETVDAFQGQEKDVIIMSCVRAQSDASSVGFLAERERMNVSLTRARLALYILGNFNTLRTNPLWNALYENAKSRGLLVSVPRARDFSNIAECKVKTR